MCKNIKHAPFKTYILCNCKIMRYYITESMKKQKNIIFMINQYFMIIRFKVLNIHTIIFLSCKIFVLAIIIKVN